MEALLIIIFIIYAVKSSDVINNLKKENKLMSEKIKELEDYINKTKSSNMISNNNSLDNFNENTEVIKKEIVNKTILSEDKIISKEEIKKENLIKEELKKKKEKDDRIRKNTSILITGAVLIVLAAIVFLTSTWNAIPNFVKTVVIILLVGVFLGLSKIAKKRFNLEKASNTFFYIAMAYIPICLISCSIFSLFGEFLSIYGEGRYLYLTVIAILTSIIYFINYAKRKSKGLLYSSLISQVSAVVLFTLIFENNINFMIINLLVYNIFLMIVSKYIGQEEKAFIYISSAIAYIVGIIVISQLFIDITLQMLIILTLLTINLFLLYKNNKISFNAYLFNFVLYGIGSYLGLFIFYKTDSEIFCGLTQIFYILIVFLTEKFY